MKGKDDKGQQTNTNVSLFECPQNSLLSSPYIIHNDCRSCDGYERFCELYEPLNKENKICMYHAYRIQEHGSLFRWKQDMSRLENMLEDLGD